MTLKKGLDMDACWATWSVPFDQEEDFMFIASAYYLSPAVRTYWEKRYEGPMLWFGTTLEGVAEHLDRLGRLDRLQGAVPDRAPPPRPRPPSRRLRIESADAGRGGPRALRLTPPGPCPSAKYSP